MTNYWPETERIINEMREVRVCVFVLLSVFERRRVAAEGSW